MIFYGQDKWAPTEGMWVMIETARRGGYRLRSNHDLGLLFSVDELEQQWIEGNYRLSAAHWSLTE